MTPRQTKLLSHTATWGVLFLIPLVHAYQHRDSYHPLHLIFVPPTMMMLLFYVNFFWLTPRYYMKGRKGFCWLVNIAMVLLLATMLHYMPGMHESYIFGLAVTPIVANCMQIATRWQQAEEQRLKAEAARADAELANLRFEMNPHFLLNTLNNIYALTAFAPHRAQEAIQQLSAMLRHMLYDNQEQTVRMEDEVRFLQSYINLMKIRQSDTVDITFKVEQAADDVRIVPLILIPLVENAFKHGISPTQPSFIHISLKADDNLIDFLIENTNHPKTDSDQSGHGIGLTQVQRRLLLAYPEQYSWQKGLSADGTVYRSHIMIKPTKTN